MSDSPDTPSNSAPRPRSLTRAATFTMPLANQVRRWRLRLARRSNAIQTRHGSEPLDVKSLHAHWIIGRDLCLYRAEDFAAIPRNRRDAAVALRIPVWSPFERTGHHCVWSGSTAMVWFWDQDAVAIHPPHLGLPETETPTADPAGPTPRIRILPESVFQPRHGTGLHLQTCANGFDLQYWHDDVLKDSLWLPQPPDAARIQAFLGQAAILADDAAPGFHEAPAESPSTFAPDPWYSPLTPQTWLIANERTLVIAGLAFFAAVAAFEEARVWRYHFAHQAAAAELSRIDEELAPVLDARDELVTLNRRNAFLAGILNEPSQAELMVRVDRALPSDTTQFRAWRYQQRDLAMTLSDTKNLDTVAVVSSLQREPMFKDVQPGRAQRDGTEITLNVDPGARQP
ncbi:MAG: hypothetical protein F4029_02255 [Gammaproteobacteria bacterium]|nr:hypothetical protein [Gammaproteobacteria bacterium]MYK45031.1 hypothetical protein [Gammaproteobacteria bacterium]